MVLLGVLLLGVLLAMPSLAEDIIARIIDEARKQNCAEVVRLFGKLSTEERARRPEVHITVGQCHLRKDQLRQAQDLLQRYIREYNPPLDNRKRAEKLLQEVRDKQRNRQIDTPPPPPPPPPPPVLISVDTRPPGAAVLLDGRPQPGKTPLNNIPVSRGKHILTLELHRHVTMNEPIDVDTSKAFIIPLKPMPPLLHVRSPDGSAKGAQVKVDGKVWGTVPLSEEGTDGTSLIEVERAGYQPFTQRLALQAGHEHEVQVTLTLAPLPPMKPAAGSLVLTYALSCQNAASSAEVSLDGDMQPRGKLIFEGLRPGGHVLQVRAPGYDPWEETVQINDGLQSAAHVQLRPRHAGPGQPPPPAQMIKIPGGRVPIGSDTGPYEERPQHLVPVPGFSIDATEVTTDDYSDCVNAGACSPPGVERQCNYGKKGRLGHPINCVDVIQAHKYCAWVKKRLPTEEEWEAAARGGDTRMYPWGQKDPQGRVCPQDSGSPTCAVGSFPAGASKHGVLDMAGSVWEWTKSRFCPYGQPQCTSNLRVIRGGYRFGATPTPRTTVRIGVVATFKADNIGFRCVR